MAKKRNLKVGIIGAGVMGTALVQNLLKRKVVGASQIILSDKNKTLLKERAKVLGVVAGQDNAASVKSADYVILAVKPQDFLDFAAGVSKINVDKKVFLSIMAGISIAQLKKHLATQRVVRAMPNLAAKVGQAFVVWKTGFTLNQQEKRFINSVFNSLGRAVTVSSEDDINKATAISGSGPAYLYYFMESLAKAAQSLGFKDELAKQMIEQTIRGAWEVYEQARTEPKILRQQVTSKRGTTEAAIKSFQKNKFDAAVKKGVLAAYKRAKELSK